MPIRLCRLLLLALICGTLTTPALPGLAQAERPLRRVAVPFYAEQIDWDTAGQFWFGRVDVSKATGAAMPGRNYADVRVAATASHLYIYVSVIDYYLWYPPTAGATVDELRQYDAVDLFLDTAAQPSTTPQASSYRFLSSYGKQRSQARGSNGSWDTGWQGTWQHQIGDQWSTGGPNNNGGNIDYGWASTMAIPWTTLGMNNQPRGSLLHMGLRLYDRDGPGNTGLAPIQAWPETLLQDTPDSWGELAFDVPAYTPPFAQAKGTTVIARGMPGAVVHDATVGGNGSCSGGHEGEPDSFNQGSDTSLYVESQSAVTDFPCFARSYLRFGIDQIPPGYVIMQASLRLYHWSQSGAITSPDPADRPQPSLVRVYAVDGNWDEQTITWNTGPLARQSLGGQTIIPRNPNVPGFQFFPGVPYEWDVTAGVAAAYAAGEPVNLALYTPDTNFHSNKYFTSSETGDWNKIARPTLTIIWGTPAPEVTRIGLPTIRSRS